MHHYWTNERKKDLYLTDLDMPFFGSPPYKIFTARLTYSFLLHLLLGANIEAQSIGFYQGEGNEDMAGVNRGFADGFGDL